MYRGVMSVNCVIRAAMSAAMTAATWWYTTFRVHSRWEFWYIACRLTLGEQLFLGLLLGGVGCLVLMLLLPLKLGRRLHPITCVFVFAVSGLLALGQMETQDRVVGSWSALRPYVEHHFP
jgi:hypothetical protein